MNPIRVFEVFMSMCTLTSALLIGNKNVWGMRLSLFAIFLWWLYIPLAEAWGLVPMQVGYTIIGFRNLIKWEREAKAQRARDWVSPGVANYYKEQERGR